MADVKDKSGSWWDSKILIAVITLIGALGASSVTYIMQKGALQVERSRLEHTITMDMLQLAVDPELTAEGRRNVMEVLSLVLTEDSLRAWARQKLAKAKDDVILVDSLRGELARMELQKDSLLMLAESGATDIGGHEPDEEALQRTIDSLDISQRQIQMQMPYSDQRMIQQTPIDESMRQRTLPEPDEQSIRRRGGR